MSSALFAQLDDLQNLSWEVAGEPYQEWEKPDPDTTNDSFDSTELDSDTRLVVSMSSNATSVQASLRKPDLKSHTKAQPARSNLRPLPTSSRALGSAFDNLGSMLECIEALAEQESLDIQQVLEETVNVLQSSTAWNTKVFRSGDLFPYKKKAGALRTRR